ncbi:MAG: DUF2851 family protein [Bacteroidota bacterium]
MREDFLHYLWRTKRFDLNSLQTTEGETVEIGVFGKHNSHAGPDFLEAKIKIGDTLWAGNVEMHVRSSEWIAHQHQNDKTYGTVILHVVFEEDEPIYRENGERIPCLELRKRIPPKIIQTYQKIVHNEHWIPCQHHFYNVSELTKNAWIDRLLVERLEQKTVHIEERLRYNKNAWEETFYQILARNFGVKVNAEPFELLATATPLHLFAKHKNSLFQIEALLFGQAGLLEKLWLDDYPKSLRKEYQFLQKKYKLQPLKGESWRFMRMRPANFPTIRLAQFATLIYQSSHLFSKILEAESIRELQKLFKVSLSDYWLDHYVFDKVTATRNKSLGKSTVQLLIINTIIPFLFLYGTRQSISAYRDKALGLLEEIAPEKNSIIDGWKILGLAPESAYETQALLQLKNEYCNVKRCLSCAVGSSILR